MTFSKKEVAVVSALMFLAGAVFSYHWTHSGFLHAIMWVGIWAGCFSAGWFSIKFINWLVP